MLDPKDRFDVDTLRKRVARVPGCPEFPALAEVERRGGDPEAARRIAEAGLAAAPGRLAGRVALGLAWLDLGNADEARRALAPILDDALEPHLRADPITKAPGVGGTFDEELEEAFASAEPEVEAMISPNHMAEQVLLDHAPVEEPEALEGLVPVDEEEAALEAPSPLFRTATMAELLARQGDEAGAEAIRRELSARSPAATAPPGVDAASVPEAGEAVWSETPGEAFPVTGAEAAHGGPGGARRSHILATLERWLQNIQRGRA